MGRAKNGESSNDKWRAERPQLLLQHYLWFRKVFHSSVLKGYSALQLCFVLCRCCFVFLGFFHTNQGKVASGKLQGQLVLVAIAGEAAL